MSFALGKQFGDSRDALDYPLEVEIADDCTLKTPSVIRGFILTLFYEKYQTNLFPIPL